MSRFIAIPEAELFSFGEPLPSVVVGKRRDWGALSPFPISAPSSEAAPVV